VAFVDDTVHVAPPVLLGRAVKVELYSAPNEPAQHFHREHEVPIPRPVRPELIRTYRLSNETDGTRYMIGRDPGDDEDGTHWPWTKFEPGATEDAQLSREQLELIRRNGRWEIRVPLGNPDKRNVTVQYWASARTDVLIKGGKSLILDPSSYIGTVVQTKSRYYWAMFTTPPDPEAPPPVGPGHTLTNKPQKRLGRITVPYDTIDSSPNLPKGWADAIRIKYEPYLTWPMGWQPKPVSPKEFAPPPPSFSLDPIPDPSNKDYVELLKKREEQYNNQVKKRLADTKLAAVRSGGYTAQNPSGFEVGLLDWLVAKGHLTFQEHRCEWSVMRVGTGS
jgi:hypothetical protein